MSSLPIDWHVVLMLAVLALAAALFGFCWILIPALVPQGRLLTRAFVDYPALHRPSGAYLLTNECVVAAVCVAAVAGRYMLT